MSSKFRQRQKNTKLQALLSIVFLLDVPNLTQQVNQTFGEYFFFYESRFLKVLLT